MQSASRVRVTGCRTGIDLIVPCGAFLYGRVGTDNLEGEADDNHHAR